MWADGRLFLREKILPNSKCVVLYCDCMSLCSKLVIVCDRINRSVFVSCMDIAVSSSVSVNDTHHIYQSFSRPATIAVRKGP